MVTIGLARGKRHAYRDALIVLALSALFAGVQTFVSIALRGKGAPQNMRFYITTFTLVVFLLLRLPPIWKLIGGFQRGGGDAATTGGLAAFVGGLVVLTTLLWATPTHIGPDGANWVNVLRLPLLAGGSLLAFGGAALVWAANRRGRAVIAEEARTEGQPVGRPLRTCQRIRDADSPISRRIGVPFLFQSQAVINQRGVFKVS